MSDYRRLISYIYAYEGEEKGRNQGFAKLEARNGVCKISISVKKIYMGSTDMGVFLLVPQKEIFLGKMFLRNGAGEFRTSVKVNSLGEHAQEYTLEQCYGLTIHDMGEHWIAYTTIWEDAVTHAAELELPTLEENEPVSVEEQEKRQIRIVKEIEEEMRAEEERESSIRTPETQLQPPVYEPEPQPQPPVHEPELQPLVNEPEPEIHNPDEDFPIGDSAVLQRLEQEEKQNQLSEAALWQRFQDCYPKIRAFDYDNESEILSIKPQDIGLLPREMWVYGNNSFLLHGYYNYRYLILARLKNSKESYRYLLGVPGHYYSNEKYMASMFGFPNFVLSNKQPAQDGRFGYWYTDIKLGQE